MRSLLKNWISRWRWAIAWCCVFGFLAIVSAIPAATSYAGMMTLAIIASLLGVACVVLLGEELRCELRINKDRDEEE